MGILFLQAAQSWGSGARGLDRASPFVHTGHLGPLESRVSPLASLIFLQGCQVVNTMFPVAFWIQIPVALVRVRISRMAQESGLHFRTLDLRLLSLRQLGP